MILDAGALIAVSRNDRAMIARLVAAEDEGDELTTHPMVVAQVWRDHRGRQAQLARLLRGVEIVSIDDDLGRRCGELLGKARTSDPIDAAVVLIATDGEPVVTSDPDDILHLARFARRRILAIRC
jgi:predicted nucleic acid-binding protein